MHQLQDLSSHPCTGSLMKAELRYQWFLITSILSKKGLCFVAVTQLNHHQYLKWQSRHPSTERKRQCKINWFCYPKAYRNPLQLLMVKQHRILNIQISDNLAPERISGTHLWCSLWLFFSAWGCVVAILTLSWSAPMLNTSLQCLSRRKQSFRKFFSKRIKNSVQVKTFNVLSIRLGSIYAQLQDPDWFYPSPKNVVWKGITKFSNKEQKYEKKGTYL